MKYRVFTGVMVLSALCLLMARASASAWQRMSPDERRAVVVGIPTYNGFCCQYGAATDCIKEWKCNPSNQNCVKNQVTLGTCADAECKFWVLWQPSNCTDVAEADVRRPKCKTTGFTTPDDCPGEDTRCEVDYTAPEQSTETQKKKTCKAQQPGPKAPLESKCPTWTEAEASALVKQCCELNGCPASCTPANCLDCYEWVWTLPWQPMAPTYPCTPGTHPN